MRKNINVNSELFFLLHWIKSKQCSRVTVARVIITIYEWIAFIIKILLNWQGFVVYWNVVRKFKDFVRFLKSTKVSLASLWLWVKSGFAWRKRIPTEKGRANAKTWFLIDLLLAKFNNNYIIIKLEQNLN